jgi:hypothetical protein
MKILYLHTNESSLMREYHNYNVNFLRKKYGFDIKIISLLDHHSFMYYKKMNELYVNSESNYMNYHNFLISELENSDVLIHMNGAMLHPSIVKAYSGKKIFQCSDDFKGWGSGTKVISRPVAKYYDYCAVGNVDCLDVYEGWGCKKVFWFPIGSSFADDQIKFQRLFSERKTEAVFIGARKGTAFPILGRLFDMYRRKSFFDKLEPKMPVPFHGYGQDWKMGFLKDNEMIETMLNYQFGINNHSFAGSVNHRMYDMAAMGLLQFCDNKYSFKQVFKLGEEAIGYDSVLELVDTISYFSSNLKKAEEIAHAGYIRYKKDYTRSAIMDKMVKECNLI